MRKKLFGFNSKHDPRALGRQKPQRRRGPRLEVLETRNMLAADVRPISELGNNLAHPIWGSAGADLVRIAPAEYADGISTPAGADRLSARAISNLVVSQDEATPLNDRDMSAFIYAWGQFLDHDIDQTLTGATAFNIQVPAGDASFDPLSTGTQLIFLNRSLADSATGTSKSNPLQQINSITSFVDGSQVYGSDAARALALRTLVGGKLKTSEGNLLPFNTLGLANDNPLGLPATSLFVAGDVRANENGELTAIQTLFVREHNRLAGAFARANPTWTDEQLYQKARQMVIAELQAITYNEFLPALFGRNVLTPYRGYNPAVNPGIATEFSTAAFRIGHTLVGEDIEFLDNNGNEVADEVALRDDFFNPAVVAATGIDPILKYLASDRAQEVDTHIVEDLRNFLFGQPGQGGLDLASLNIQRGRDHGLADYNATRVAYGLPAVRSFADITSDVETQNDLRAAYGSVDNIDLWVGGLAEDHQPGSSVGQLFTRIIADQFQRLRDGDRFWYERTLSPQEVAKVNSTSLADVIRLNTTTTNLQDNVFFFKTSISGRVLSDALDPRGVQSFNAPRQGVAGVSVQLQDLDGNIIASTVTARDGSYAFDDLDLGTYRVVIVPAATQAPAVPTPIEVSLTRGQPIKGIDFSLKVKVTIPTAPSGPTHNQPPLGNHPNQPGGPFGRPDFGNLGRDRFGR